VVSSILSLRLISGPLPVVVGALGVVALAWLLASRRWRSWLPIAASVSLAGFIAGLILCWVLGDLLDLFGVDLSIASRVWFAVGFAGLALAVARALFSGGRAILPSAAAAIVVMLVGGLGLNADLGEFPTVRNALGIGQYGTLRLPPRSAGTALAGWVAPADLPSSGRIGYVAIPATASHFRARRALVYLPPAALMVDPPKLPVLVMLAGQPGGPSDLFVKGGLGGILDSWARAHHGLAPIVVVPDQLGAPARNPMCVDSALGHVATYLTRDVPAWISAHLTTLAGPAGTGIGGFSEGGTCSIQLGAARPSLYGTIVDISGQVAPKNGSTRQTIDRGFAGSRSSYERAIPANILASRAPYRSTFAVFATGADDLRYGPGLRTVAAAGRAAGMDSTLVISPGTAHDWHTVAYAFDRAIPLVARHWGLDG
jgi:S-formylglutathione hydrolase FrmB